MCVFLLLLFVHRYSINLFITLFRRVGVVFYEYLQLKKTLNSLVNTDAIDINAKHPDYIYIKYHIYRESMLRRKHEELADKVRLLIFGRYSPFWNTYSTTYLSSISIENRNGWMWSCIRWANGGKQLSIRLRGVY